MICLFPWTRIEDALPESGRRVLAYDGGSPRPDLSIATFFDFGAGRYWRDDNCNDLDVTHWMPLPDVPEVKPPERMP